tara:strand:+ start:192 stop:521 length:330 start_codon:yes stop_codon:yes gene_type:complete
MAYKKNALLNLGMADPNQFTNTTGMVDYNRILQQNNLANNEERGRFSSTTQAAADDLFGTAINKQKSMSDMNSATLNSNPPLFNLEDKPKGVWEKGLYNRRKFHKNLNQ